MAGHAQLKVVMTECSKTQIRLAGLKLAAFKSQNKNMIVEQLITTTELNFNVIKEKQIARIPP